MMKRALAAVAGILTGAAAALILGYTLTAIAALHVYPFREEEQR